MSCWYNGYAYVPSGEALGHRGKVAKLNVVSLQERRADGHLGKIEGRCTITVVVESTAFKFQNDCRTPRCLPGFPGTSASSPKARADKAKPQGSLTYPN